MRSLLSEIFENEGETLKISGNNPILLEGRENVWFVVSGSAEVFAVQVEDGGLTGRKEHFFHAGEGDLLFGMDLENGGRRQAFQAVGFPGTRVARLTVKRLGELGSQKSFEEEVCRRVDTWVAGLSEGLTKDIVPRPRPDTLLDSGVEASMDVDKIAYPRKGVLWLRCRGGSGFYIGTEELPSNDRLLPLCEKSWIQLLSGSAIETFSTRDALSVDLVWGSLDQFYALVFQILLLNTGLYAADVYNLLREKIDEDRRAKDAGLVQLDSVLRKRPIRPPSGVFDDHLLSACALVGETLEITIKEPRRVKREAVKPPVSMEDIARASRVNVRKVSLRGEWWKRDNGPMVGFVEEGNRPVALLPLSPFAYEMADPAEGARIRVSQEEAEALSPTAYAFYRFFPDRALAGRDLLRFGFSGCGKDLLRILIFGAIIGILSLFTPIAIDHIFGDIIPGSDRARLLQIVVILVSFAITTAMFEVTRNIGILRVEYKLYYSIEAAIWDRILRLPIPFFRQYTAGDLASRGMGMDMASQLVSGPVTTTMIGSLFVTFNFILLFYYHRNLALVATALLMLAVLVVVWLGLLQLKYFRRVTEIEGFISGRVLQFVSALTKLRVCGAEDRAFAIWAKDFSRKKKMAFKGGVAGNFLATFNKGFLVLSLIVLFSWLVFREEGSGLSTGDFLGFNSAYSNLQAAVFQIVMSLNALITAIPYFERVKPILEAAPEVDTIKADPGELSGKIEVYHAFFRYTPEAPVLKDVSMRIEPGEFVAVVGPSGSGKSTLVRLLLGFERPETGTIYYDDQDLSELDVTSVRKNIGVVVQGGNVMAGDIFQNIIGNHPLTVDDAWEAAKMAGLEEDIREMPMGMNTVVMEGAATLSGGQRQRLMIARAIVNRPRILIFDEATSALDNRTQAVVSESLKKLKSTRIVVAHRLSTIRDADRIFVMDKGEIAETGTYEELMARNGIFEKLARRQIL